MRFSAVLALIFLVLSVLIPSLAEAHGERAQQPALRMRTVEWFDVSVSTKQLQVNDILVVKGSFVPSNYWPEHVHSIEGASYLNIGVPGPTFVRLDSRINGTPGIRSTAFHKGELYNFEITLKARKPGKYHIHPLINVESAGPVIGPGIWVEVTGSEAQFTNTAKTLLGQTVDMEHYNFGHTVAWSALWMLIAAAWIVYWLFSRRPLIVPRFKRVSELGQDADAILTPTDRRLGLLFLIITLSVTMGGYLYANDRWPITTPLQTGKVHTPPAVQAPMPLEVTMGEARYRIPGRSFRIELTVSNKSDRPLSIGEFSAGNLRFINSKVLDIKPTDEDDLVAPDALRVEGGPIPAGETRKLVIYADDAMWETQRMTTMIASPDAVIAGMLFFYDDQGKRYYAEIGGPMIPVFG